METINNIANAAVKVVWGDSEANKEPISGEKGDVSKGQPYDAGNLGLSEQEKVQDKLDTNRTNEPGVTSSSTSAPTNSSTLSDKPATSSSTSTSTDTGAANTTSPAIPPTNVGNADSVSKPSVTDASGAQPSLSDSSAAQNDTRDPDDENAQIEPKGPGPRPLNVVAKEHGGDAGSKDSISKDSVSSSSSDESKAGATPAADSESQGSGQQYVKASGLAADGGDFDATKPGAGREADRLMEEKGIHHDDTKSSGHGSSSHSGHTKDKPSLGERIKAKLHKH
ncbi:hypothetical protein HJFPF1_03458 [Paramyrothecium foliicola]|nr:hypothetical protein HJFPF1_03458 [Paramyrothecium foliicola]